MKNESTKSSQESGKTLEDFLSIYRSLPPLWEDFIAHAHRIISLSTISNTDFICFRCEHILRLSWDRFDPLTCYSTLLDWWPEYVVCAADKKSPFKESLKINSKVSTRKYKLVSIVNESPTCPRSSSGKSFLERKD